MSIYRAYLETMPPFEPVRLGFDRSGQAITLAYEDFVPHVHVIGLSRRGKSRAIEHILRQFLINGIGFTLLDPHRDIYDPLVHWLTAQGSYLLRNQTVHLFDASDPEYSPGFNPLQVRPGENLEDRADWFMDAVSQMLGGEDLDRMPQYKMIFRAFVYALVEKGLTANEVLLFLPQSEEALRAQLSRGLSNRVNVQVWKDIHSWTPKEYRELTGSFYRRMCDVLHNPAAQRILAQKKKLLDVLEVMDRGQTVLVNLKPERGGLTRITSKLFGRLLINEYYQTATTHRVARKSRPHFLVIDECHDYLSEDVVHGLDGTAKYGLHFVLSHQRIEQLRDISDNICDGVLSGAQTKWIFGSSYQSGLELADVVAAPSYDTERPKESSRKPFVVGYHKEIHRGGGQSQGRNEARTQTQTQGEAVGHTASTVDTVGSAIGASTSETETEGLARGRSTSRTETEGDAVGYTRSTMEAFGKARGRSTSHIEAEGETFSETTYESEAVGLSEGHSFSSGMADGSSTNFSSSASGGMASGASYGYDDPMMMGMPLETPDSMNLSETTIDAGGFTEGGGESHLESSSEGVSFVESRQRMTGSARGHARSRSTATAETESEVESYVEAFGVAKSQVSSRASSIGEAESEVESQARSRGTTQSQVDSRSKAQGTADSRVSSRQTAEALQHGTSDSTSETWQEAMVPDIEMLPTSYATLEEERHRVAVAIQSLPPQSFIFKPAVGTSVTLGQTETIELIECQPHEVRGLVRRLCATTGINMLKNEVDAAINARWLGIQRALGPTILRPPKVKSVLEETGFDEDAADEDPTDDPMFWAG